MKKQLKSIQVIHKTIEDLSFKVESINKEIEDLSKVIDRRREHLKNCIQQISNQLNKMETLLWFIDEEK